MNWEASWIWGGEAESPRNEWRCFRRSFVPGKQVRDARVRLTADSRYILYVNGTLVGRGPVRSWPFELAYDEYEIGHLLRPGAEATIAVLVLHYGISTFQYLRGRGGLLLEVDDARDADGRRIVTDASWSTNVHEGFDPRASRISCQLGFTELFDARKLDPSWTSPGFDDDAWPSAAVVGPAGIAPWTSLVPRPIPYLTEEPVFPARVESLRMVKAPAWTAALDVRAAMSPESAAHANNVSFCGGMAAVLRLERQAAVTIGIVDNGRLRAPLRVNGALIAPERYTGEHPERYVELDLEAGEHLLLWDLTGTSHGHAFHLGIDAKGAPFSLRAPAAARGADPAAAADSPFVLIGPFATVEHIDHQPERLLDTSSAAYEQIREAASEAELAGFAEWIRPLDPAYVNLRGVFASNVWTIEAKELAVPAALQHAAIAGPNAATVPNPEQGFDTELVIDFGRERSGYVVLELDSDAGVVVDGYGLEYMKDGWRQHTFDVDNTFRYVCREGRQTFVSAVRRGLRYLALTVRGAERPVRLYEVKLLQSNFPVADVGAFRASDPLLGDIWTISRDTTRLCMEDTFVDCPAFEQAYWVGDARNEALVNYYAFGAKEIVEFCLKLVPGSSFQTPLYADQLPSGWNSVIPNWTFFWVTACREYYEFSGDSSFVDSIWPHVAFTLEHYLELLNEDGLMEREGWNLLDWAPFEQPRAGVVTPQNMFLVKALREGASLGRLVGAQERAEALEAAADRLAKAVERRLWNEDRQAYIDCIHADGRPASTFSMQTQIVAYLCDIPANDERLKRVAEMVVAPPEGFVPAGSPFMSFFYYEALAKLGRIDVLLADMRKHYGFMVEHGATTCWEMYPWSGYNANPKLLTRSHCHAWSAGPAYFLGRLVLGVEGLTPGWTRVRVAPKPCDLHWASGSVPLPSDGRIDVEWRMVGENRIHLVVAAPAGIELETVAPEGCEMTVELRRI